MKKENIKESGILIFIFLVFLFIGPSILFFLKIPILSVNVLIYFTLACLFYYFICTKIRKEKVHLSSFSKSILIASIVIVFFLFVSCFLFDRSSDGDTYHKDAIGVLKEGFNPVYSSSLEFIKNREDDSKSLTTYSIWTDHYAKANWMIAANFYSFTGNIESAKAMNFLSLYVLFTFIYFTFLEKWGWKKSFVFSLVVTLNPITASQLYTFYNDFLVCVYLFLSIFFLLQLDKKETKELWIYYGLCFILLSNLKFNGLGYLLVFSFFFMCRKLYYAWKKKEFLPVFRKLVCIFIPLFVISLLVVGYPTYVKNMIEHKTPFFPLYGEGKQDIMTHQQPKKFAKMMPIQKLFYSTFSKVNNLRENDYLDLKVPFSLSKSEIVPATSYDLRISGFGVWFSGILCISILLLGFFHSKYKKDSRLIFTLAITILLLLVMNESWWARYTPHFYLFILASLYILFEYGNTKKWKIHAVYVLFIIFNMLLPLLGNSYYVLTNSFKIHNQMRSLRDKEIVLDVHGYHGIVYNFKDYHIPYQLKEGVSSKKVFYDMVDYQVISNEK